MWTTARKIYTVIFINAAICLFHVEAFQSGIPYLAWLTISLHVLGIAYFLGFFKLALFLFANFAAILGHIEAFQSPIPWLAWFTVAAHAYVVLFLIIRKFSHNKQSTNEKL